MNDYPFGMGRGDSPAFEYHHGGPSTLAWTIFALQILLLLGLGTLLVSALGSRFGRRPAPAGPAPARSEPLEIVRLRYARGELDREQYLQATQDLGGREDEPPPPPEQAA